MTSTLPTDLPVDQDGDPAARIALVLHGGGGPQTVAPIVGHLAATMHAVAPTHPGWRPSPRSPTSRTRTSTTSSTATSTTSS